MRTVSWSSRTVLNRFAVCAGTWVFFGIMVSERPATVSTPYVNTIPRESEPFFPGDEHIERRIRAFIRWNAAVMVSRANVHHPSLGGHLLRKAQALVEHGEEHTLDLQVPIQPSLDQPDGVEHQRAFAKPGQELPAQPRRAPTREREQRDHHEQCNDVVANPVAGHGDGGRQNQPENKSGFSRHVSLRNQS